MMLTYLGYGVILGLVEHCICVACMKLTTLCVGSDVMFDLQDVNIAFSKCDVWQYDVNNVVKRDGVMLGWLVC